MQTPEPLADRMDEIIASIDPQKSIRAMVEDFQALHVEFDRIGLVLPLGVNASYVDALESVWVLRLSGIDRHCRFPSVSEDEAGSLGVAAEVVAQKLPECTPFVDQPLYQLLLIHGLDGQPLLRHRHQGES